MPDKISNKNTLRIRKLIASDSLAISFLTMADYRTMLLKAIDTMLESEEFNERLENGKV
jgi:predicted nucleic acid-binding protein